MSEVKNYFYLKLKDNFFDRPEIKAIEGMQSGYEYICIMQKMYLRSLSREGKLMLTDTVPYELEMLSAVLNHKQETIKCAVDVFLKLGLCEVLEDRSIYMTEIQQFIGKSNNEADRVRQYRARIESDKNMKRIECTNDVQTYKDCTKIEYDQTPKIELKTELELETKTEQNNSSFTFHQFKEVLDHFNSKSIKKFISIPPAHQLLIEEQHRLGFTLDDFKYVIDVKFAEWLGDKVMDKNLNFKTLFGPNFQTYKNQKIITDEIKKPIELSKNKIICPRCNIEVPPHRTCMKCEGFVYED